MDRRTPLLAILVVVLAIFTLGTEAIKSSNRTDRCYKPCRVKSTPVCGNDGRNYTTGCHLSVARCKVRRFGQLIYPVNTGYCQSSKPVSQCFLNCTQYKAPVCASDKKTYKNLCLFKKAKCEARKRKDPPLTIVNRKGPCSKKALTSCRPFSDCPKVKRPVCGSDNKTYHNICHLKGKGCRIKRAAKGRKYKKLTLKYCGACGRGKRCAAAWTQKCPEVKFCDQLLRAAVRHAETKKAESNSLSKNGNNKRVPRLPKKHPKKTSTKKTNTKKVKTQKPKKTKGKKTSSKKLLMKTKPSKKQKPKTNKPSSKVSKKPEKVIPKKVFQVCGSDGVTYPSLCHLQVEQCNKINRCQRLQMKHKGACKKQPSRRS